MAQQDKPGGVARPNLSLPFPPNVSAEHLAWRSLQWEVSLFRRGGSYHGPEGQVLLSWWNVASAQEVVSAETHLSDLSYC